MNAAIYARSGAPDEANIAQQVEKCRDWAAQHGYEVARVFEDNGYGGDSLARPGWCALDAFLTEGGTRTVITSDWARLTRDPQTMQALAQDFQSRGVEVCAIADGQIQIETPRLVQVEDEENVPPLKQEKVRRKKRAARPKRVARRTSRSKSRR